MIWILKNTISLFLMILFVTSQVFIQFLSFSLEEEKKNATLFFITQSYFDTPKIIRLQCNYFFFWKLNDDREQTEIHKNHSFGLPKKDFKDVFQEETGKLHSFLFLDTINKSQSYRIRKNLDQPINVLPK